MTTSRETHALFESLVADATMARPPTGASRRR